MTEPLTPREREEVDAELHRLFADLGRYLATPAINEVAERRRRWSIDVTRREIALLQGVLAGAVGA